MACFAVAGNRGVLIRPFSSPFFRQDNFHFDEIEARKRYFQITSTNSSGKWSPPMNVNDVGDIYIAINEGTPQASVLRVKIVLVGPAVQIIMSLWERATPFKLENRSNYPVIFFQDVEEAKQKR
jgi:hypothetical protein